DDRDDDEQTGECTDCQDKGFPGKVQRQFLQLHDFAPDHEKEFRERETENDPCRCRQSAEDHRLEKHQFIELLLTHPEMHQDAELFCPCLQKRTQGIEQEEQRENIQHDFRDEHAAHGQYAEPFFLE